MAGGGRLEGFGHVIVGFGERDFLVVGNFVGENLAVTTFDDDFVTSVERVEMLQNAFDIGAAVVAIHDEDAAGARFAGLAVPADVKNAVGGVEFAGFVDAHFKDASVFDAELGDGEIARLVGGDGVFATLLFGDFFFADFLDDFLDEVSDGARHAFFFVVIIMFPNGGAGKEEGEGKEDEAEKNLADESARLFEIHIVSVFRLFEGEIRLLLFGRFGGLCRSFFFGLFLLILFHATLSRLFCCFSELFRFLSFFNFGAFSFVVFAVIVVGNHEGARIDGAKVF